MRRLLPALVWLLAAVCAAEDPGTLPLTLSEASLRALSHNTSLLVERENLTQADLAVTRARGAYDLFLGTDVAYRDRTDPVNSIFSGAPDGILAPSIKGVDASATFTQLLPTGGSAELFSNWGRGTTNNVFTILSPAYTTGVGVSLRQPILRGLMIDPAREAIRVAAAQRGQSVARLKRIVSDVLTQVDAAYWSLVAARRDVASIASSVELAGQQLSETKSRVEAGVLGETDVAQPTAEQERRRGNLALARQRVTEAENTLKRLMLADTNDPAWSREIVPTDEPETAVTTPALPDALAAGQEKRPEIAEARAQRTVSEVEVEARRGDVLPRLDLVASYARRGLAGTANPDAEDFNGGPITVPGPILGGVGPLLRHDRREPFSGRVHRPLLLRADHQPHRAGEPRDRALPATQASLGDHRDAAAGGVGGAQRRRGAGDGTAADRRRRARHAWPRRRSSTPSRSASTSACRRTSWCSRDRTT